MHTLTKGNKLYQKTRGILKRSNICIVEILATIVFINEKNITRNCKSYSCMKDCLIYEMSCSIYNVVLIYNRCQHCQHVKAESEARWSLPRICDHDVSKL